MGFFLFTKENIEVKSYKKTISCHPLLNQRQIAGIQPFRLATKRNPLPETPEQRIV